MNLRIGDISIDYFTYFRDLYLIFDIFLNEKHKQKNNT